MREILVLGPDPARTGPFVANVRAALEELDLEATVEVVSDDARIMLHGVTLTPALVIDDALRVMGRVAETDEIKRLIQMETA